MTKFVGLVKGRIVRYVDSLGNVSPAAVVDVLDANKGTVNLGVLGRSYTFRDGIVYSERKAHDTWHWPPRTE